MKQNKRTTILKLALLAVCIAVLATALVACGEKDKNGNNNEIVNFADNELCSSEALESYMGYCIENSYAFICARDPDFGFIDLGPMFVMSFRGRTSEYYSVFVFICQSESDANKASDPQYYPGYAITQNKNVLIIEKENGIFQNEILKSKIPDSYHRSELHINMVKEAFNSIATCDDEAYDTEFAYKYGEDGEDLYCIDNRMGFSQSKRWEFAKHKENDYSLKQLEGLLPKLKTDYTDDSFINLNEEGGYYSAKLIDRPDTYRYEDYTYKDGETKIDGIRITEYICTKDSSQSLIVPAKIDNKPVIDVWLERINSTTVELMDGILRVNVYNCINLETLILPKSLKYILNSPSGSPIQGCYSLKTIKYAGTKAEWEERVKDNDPNNWYVEKEHDYENDKNTYKYITFKVECLDETITYLHE